MKKLFLLVAGDQYYPERGDGDWIACYSTEQEADAQVKEVEVERKLFGGKLEKNKYYQINGRNYDWYEIINLEGWISS